MEHIERPSKHVCLTRRGPMTILCDPQLDILTALADADVLTLVRGLMKEELKSPFPEGAFGLTEPQTNASIRRMKSAGLISSRREGPDHVYFLNKGRFRELSLFLNSILES